MTTVDIKRWEEKVRAELKGKAWDSVFHHKTADGIDIPPVYTRQDRSFGQPIAKSKLGWKRIWALQPEAENADILQALSLGVDTLWIRFELLGHGGKRHGWNTVDVSFWKSLFQGVHLSMLTLLIEAPSQTAEVKALFAELSPNHSNCLFLKDSLSESLVGADRSDTDVCSLSNTELAQLCGATPAQELELQLRTWATILEASSAEPVSCAKDIQILLPADAHIFETVAKFRALRQLWHAFWGCLGVEVEPQIHAVTSPRMMSDVDEYTNILRVTHASTAAIMGGCDGLCILPFDYRLSAKNSEAQRMSAIIHAILEEESLLGSIQDPMAGSYYVEALTEQLSEKAWSAFRAWAKSAPHRLIDDDIRERIQKAQKARQSAIAHRQIPLTSISEFPKVDVALSPRTTHWSVGQGTVSYDGDVFTDLRRSQQSEKRLHIVCIGQESEWTARYHFTLNAFAVGGWQHELHRIAEASELNQIFYGLPSTEPVCLCAPNGIYTELAAQGWTTPRKSYLAGPKSLAEAIGMRAVYLGCDLHAILQELVLEQEAV